MSRFEAATTVPVISLHPYYFKELKKEQVDRNLICLVAILNPFFKQSILHHTTFTT